MASTIRTWKYTTITGRLEDSLVRDEAAPAPDNTTLSADQLIVEVITAALNPVDYKLPEAGWIGDAMIKRPATPGLDYCGRVVAKHPSNDKVKLGQVVFGGLPGGGKFGTVGQLALTSTSESAVLPDGVDPDHAAAVGTAATTAYQSLIPHVQKGWRIFINGGSGGVGTWAIQFAKVKGAEVVASCSTANIELCQQLGADEVIDYKKTDLIQTLKENGHTFDAVIDVHGSTEIYDNRALYLKPGGWFVQVGTGPLTTGSILTTFSRTFWPTLLNAGRRKYLFIQQKNAAEYFDQIGKWMAEGKIRAVISEEFEWENVPAAIAKLRDGHAKGKILVHVGKK